MRLIFFILFLLCWVQFSSSQNIISGRIFDKNTGDNLPFVNVYVKNTTLGVISNSDGVFSIVLPDIYLNFELVFSIIGYSVYEKKISDFNLVDNTNSIGLSVSTLKLDEFVVTAKKIQIDSIVLTAFDNYYTNFPNKPFISKAFMRHIEKTGIEYKWLLEAALDIYDPGYNKSPKGILVNVVEVRKSLDNRYLDTLNIYKFYLKHFLKKSNRTVWNKKFSLDNISKIEIKKAIQYHDNFFTLQGWKTDFLESLLSTDHNKLRFFNEKDAVIDKNFNKKHSFKLDTILRLAGEKIYKVKILPKNPPARLNRFKKDREIPFGWIFIKSKDFSIVELVYSLVENTSVSSLNSEIFGTKLISIYNIKYKEYEGRMFPYYMSLTTPKGNRFMESLDGLQKGNFMINSEDLHYFSKQEILFTNIITNQSIVRNSHLISEWKNNLFTSSPYNVSFWNEYNALFETFEEQKMRQDLERKMSLNDQFKISN